MPTRKRAFVRSDNTAEYTCPECGRRHTIRLEGPVRSSTPVRSRIRCQCGESHVVFLERRAHVRHEVQIPGRVKLRHEEAKRRMLVRNLSRTGVLFEVDRDAAVDVGDRVIVEFCLEHAERTHVLKEVVVRRVAENRVGGEFEAGWGGSQYDRVYDLALAQYIQVMS